MTLDCRKPLSSFAFNFNLRRYTEVNRAIYRCVPSAGRTRPGSAGATRQGLAYSFADYLLMMYRCTRAYSPHPPP
jgi:hypothetical protein